MEEERIAVVTDVNREFDTGPLSWVQSEIDQSLARSLESLTLFGQSIKAQPGGDQASLQRARAHFRQAAGAIQMVGLEALVAYTDEIEFHLEHLEPGRDAGHQAAVVAGAEQACRKLRIFLSELVRGAPLVPLSLFPEYEALQRLRGIKASNPTDLFFPDLSPRVPDTGPRQDIAPAQMAHFLINERRTYQQGLLSWLRGDVHGADMMGKAADNIEGATQQQAVRTFWWTVNALFDAVRADAVDNSFALKQLLARVDLQIRRLIDGSGSVAERLRRETLYLLAISPPVSEKVRQVQALYRLAAWLPASSEGAADTLHAYRAMREIQSMVLEAKNLWLRLIAGQIDQFPKLRESLLGLRNKAADSTYPETQSLFEALLKGCDVLPVQGIAETIAMEYATALLFAEDVFAEGGNPIDGLAPQVQSMRSRIETALSGQPLPALDLPKLVELSQRAQNRLLLAQVAQDIQANLRHMEQELDNFFRDTSKRDGLATLAKDGREISGALRILGLDTADALLSACMQQIAGYTAPNSTLLHEDFELLAESLSALGFYIEALEQQRPQSEDLIVPLLKRQRQRMGGDVEEVIVAPATAAHEASTLAAREAEKKSEQESKALEAQIETALAAFDPEILEEDFSAESELATVGGMGLPGHEALSIEATLEHDIVALQALGQQLRQTPADAALQQQIQKKVLMLADDAKLVGNAALLDKLKPIRQKIEEGAFNQLPSLLSALTEAPQIEAPSAEAQRLLKVDATQLDAELLDIYLQEAIEVLDTVCEHRGILASNPRDQEALRTVRRGFHTLKGSGRMVGLTELGELAYDVEKIHNRLLENGHMATPAVLALIDVAASDFRAWVETLMATKAVSPNPARLHAAIDAVDKELNPAAEIGLPTPSPLTAVATAAPEDALIQALAAFEGSQPVPVVEPPTTPSVVPQAKTAPTRSEADLSSWADWTSVPSPARAARRDETIVAPLPVQTHQAHEVVSTKEAEYAVATPRLHEVSGSIADVQVKPEGRVEVAAAESVVAEPLPVESDSVNVGEVVLSKVLYGLFTEEAEQHWAVLNHELALMQIDPHHMLSLAMMRAAHTLAGIHLTAGFPRVAKVAKTLELMLIAISGREHEKNNLVSSRAVPVVARAVAGLRTLIDRIHAKEAFAPAELREAEAIEAEISALHQQIADGQFLDAESVELREAQRQSESEEAMLVSAKSVEKNAEAEASKPGSVTPALTKELLALLSINTSVAPMPEQGDVADALLTIHDEVDAQLLPLFLEEGSDLYKQAGTLLRSLIKQPADQETQLKLKRNLHTFKGSARMAGAMRLGELAHQMETRLESLPLETSKEGLDAAYADALETDLDHLGYLLDKLKAGDVNAALPWLSVEADTESLQDDAPSQVMPLSVPTQSTGQNIDKKSAPAVVVPAVRSMGAPTSSALPRVEDGQLRVSASQIDRLVNEAGEIIITRTRAEGELRSLKGELLELTNSVVRLRNHVRVIEIEAESQIQAQLEQMQDLRGDFDPLEFDRYTRLQELTRSIAEGVNDVSTVQQSMLVYLDSVNGALLSQARLSRDVQQALFSVRTVPFSSVSDRLYRILRSLSKELHKRANLEIQGGQSGLDRAVLEKLVGPLEHLLRNALDHGVEAPEVRRAANKAETADITVAVRQAGNEIVIEIADDGAGLDLNQLRQAALEKGVITGDETLSDENVLDLIFRPGFSTSKDVTQVSGRGMGMDIVRNEVVSLGGRIDVSSVLGQGTRFTLYLPLTVAVAQTVLIRGVEGRIWAIPVAMVEQVEHVTESALQEMYDRGEVERRGERYPFYYFDRLVDRDDTLPESKRYNAILFLRTGQGRLVMHVDHMLGNQEVVIKNAGTQLARVPGLAGATILGDGQIVLIVNPIQLSQRTGVPAFTAAGGGNKAAGTASAQQPAMLAPSVLIVDDSLTIRKVTSRLMTREGYTVETAKDGFDALQKVSEHRPDVILLDIEMPRMDGFEFAKMMKGDRLTRSIPIIMITSRTAEKHRARAKELEVDAYLGKPYQEEELLSHIKQVLAPTKH